MRIDHGNYSISEIRDMLARRDLIVNRDYQRGPRLWPSGPRTYFIDTILNDFPFPKLYFYEYLDRENRRTRRELVDGQQRLFTIVDFLDDKFSLTEGSRKFAGRRYSDLSSDLQDLFLSYSIPVDVIRNADQSDILEMFRRMNAYTLPLNAAEKRHSTFTGTFKWFINRSADQFASVFVEFGVFTSRQIVRMADAELLADMIVAFEKGIITTTSKKLSDIYRQYDETFDKQRDYHNLLSEFFDFVMEELSEFKGSYLMKPYVVHSLFCAAMHNKYGIVGLAEESGLAPIGSFYSRRDEATSSLRALANAHETNDSGGQFSKYLWGCSGGTNVESRRIERVRYLLLALRGELLTE